jgi:hypothetical protein
MHVGKSADGGIDVLLVTTSNKKILVQVKRRTRPSTEPVETVRSLLGVLLTNGSLHGIVVSTADHFSWAAKSLVSQFMLNPVGHRIDLRDFGKLREMVKSVHSVESWLTYMTAACRYLELANKEIERLHSVPGGPFSAVQMLGISLSDLYGTRSGIIIPTSPESTSDESTSADDA